MVESGNFLITNANATLGGEINRPQNEVSERPSVSHKFQRLIATFVTMDII